jgi:hypothetical protein
MILLLSFSGKKTFISMSSALKTETVNASVRLVPLYQTRGHHIQEDNMFRRRCRKNLKRKPFPTEKYFFTPLSSVRSHYRVDLIYDVILRLYFYTFVVVVS